MKSNKKRLFKLFSLAVFTVCFLSCEEEPVLEFDEKTFYKEWAAWEALGIKDYSVTIKWIIHSPFPDSFFYQLNVRKNTLIGVESLDGRKYSNGIYMPTIKAHFDVIEAISKSHKNSRGYIRLTYNMDYHYPEIIDYYLPEGGRNGLGSETRYLSEFKPFTPETEEK